MNLDQVSRTAYHEAGHAVMHVFLRLDNLDRVSIIRAGETAGRVTSRAGCEYLIADMRESEPWPMVRRARVAVRKRLWMVMAGPMAEFSRPHHTDLKMVNELCRKLGRKNWKQVRDCAKSRCA